MVSCGCWSGKSNSTSTGNLALLPNSSSWVQYSDQLMPALMFCTRTKQLKASRPSSSVLQKHTWQGPRLGFYLISPPFHHIGDDRPLFCLFRSQQSVNFSHHTTLEVCPMIAVQNLGNSKTAYNILHQYLCNRLNILIS